jgi:ABC-type branched-subunit amino acid transport system substrate-binding protein
MSMVALFLVFSAPLATVAAAEKGPVKIGFVAPLTGPFAQIGMDMVEGFKLF